MVKRFVENFFTEKTPDFFQRGIMNLPNRWRKVIDARGDYCSD